MAVLLVAIFFVVLFFALLPEFLPSISRRVVQLVVQEKDEEAQLRQQLNQLQWDLREINMVDEFAMYARTERRINKLRDELSAYSKNRNEVFLKMKLGSNVIFHILQVICLISIVWTYRYVPLLTIPVDWLYPLQSIIAFPTGTPGAVGVTCWMLACRSVVSKGFQLCGRS